PLLPLGDVTNAKIGSKIDHAHASGNEFGRLLHGNAVGRGEEDRVALLERSILRRDELQINSAAQAREHVGHSHARLATRGDGSEYEPRMPRQQAHQLDARVPRTAYNSNLDHACSSLPKT